MHSHAHPCYIEEHSVKASHGVACLASQILSAEQSARLQTASLSVMPDATVLGLLLLASMPSTCPRHVTLSGIDHSGSSSAPAFSAVHAGAAACGAALLAGRGSPSEDCSSGMGVPVAAHPAPRAHEPDVGSLCLTWPPGDPGTEASLEMQVWG